MQDKISFFGYLVIGVVVVVIIAGFFIIGSPQEERLRRFDEARVSDLQFLQSEIISYWQNKEELPGELSLLEDDIRGVQIPQDPETDDAYEYQVKGPETFELCAVFNRPSLEAEEFGLDRPMPIKAPGLVPKPYYLEQQNWHHEAGRVCFERTIDKDFYELRDGDERD